MKRISLALIREQIQTVGRRFPVSILMVVAFTVCAICVNHRLIVDEACMFFALFYPASGALLATVVHLYNEEQRSRPRGWGIHLATQLAWLGFMLYFVSEWEPGIIRFSALIALMVAMVVAGFLVSFIREKTDLPLWHFTLRTLLAVIVAGATGALLMAGINLLLASFQQLFGLNIPENGFLDVVAVCGGFIAPIVFLQLLPHGERKHDQRAEGLPRWGYAIIHYLFLPLTVAYLATLYVYAAKILVQWQLPNGWVSWLVSTLMLMMVVLLTAIYPARFSENHKTDRLVTRWLPVLVLPLLVLMTVGIVRRFSDYGITVLRLYLALFNLWCYGVCLWLILRRGSRLGWIPASFALLLVLASVGPQSFAHITRRSLQAKAVSALQAYGIRHLPMRQADVKTWQRDTTEAHRRVSEVLQYLATTYKSHELARLADPQALALLRTMDTEVAMKPNDIRLLSNYDSDNNTLILPENRHNMVSGYFTAEDVVRTGDTLRCTVTVKANRQKLPIPLTFSCRELQEFANTSARPAVVTMPEATLYLDELTYIEDTHSLTFNAYIFY